MQSANSGVKTPPTGHAKNASVRWIGGLGLLLAALLSACASSPKAAPESAPQPDVLQGTGETPVLVSYEEPDDPWMPFNRAVFGFNDVSYRYVFIPIARGYDWITPEPVQNALGRFFHNLAMPVRLINHLLQWEIKGSGTNLARFGINSTLGLAGFFDPATHWFEMERADTDFSRTLYRYGSGQGNYVVLPFIGPSDVRGGVGRVVDAFLHPVPYLLNSPEQTIVRGVDILQDQAPTLLNYEELRNQSEDPYRFFRNLYLQSEQRDDDYAD